mgnify:CR=1 FL=1
MKRDSALNNYQASLEGMDGKTGLVSGDKTLRMTLCQSRHKELSKGNEMDYIDEILDDVESGKTSPDDAKDKIKGDWHRGTGHKGAFCCHMSPMRSGVSMFGIYLVLQGIVMIGHFVGWFPAAGSWWNLVWPVLIVTFGIGMIIKAAKRSGFSLMGLLLFALGAGRLVLNTGVIESHSWWGVFWPACLVAVGISFIVRSMNRKKEGFEFYEW